MQAGKLLWFAALIFGLSILMAACDDGGDDVSFGDSDGDGETSEESDGDSDKDNGGDGDVDNAGSCSVTITDPLDGSRLESDTVNVSVSVDGAETAEIVIKNGDVTSEPVSKKVVEGKVIFRDVVFDFGTSAITVSAIAKDGNSCNDTVSVSLLPTATFDNVDFTYEDDAPSSADGVQVEISLTTEEGATVALEVGGTNYGTQEADADGKVRFSGVDLEPGANAATATVTLNTAEQEVYETITLSGCRLMFVAPEVEAALSDAGGDCNTTCGDDLNCNKPNLQYNVVVSAENVAAGEVAELEINGAGPYEATAGNEEITFNAVDLPDGSVELIVTAMGTEGKEGVACEAEIVIPVEVTCDCHLVVEPVPDDYNMNSEDQNSETEGFQRVYAVSSDNCLNGSEVELDHNGIKSSKVLANGTSEFEITFEEGSQQLSWNITELNSESDETGRTGAAGPYNFKVDRNAPEISLDTLVEAAVVTVNHDTDFDLSNGIQMRISGTAEGVEVLVPAIEIALNVSDADGSLDDYSAALDEDGKFQLEGVNLPRPEGSEDTRAFILTFTVSDELGNESELVVNITGQYSEASVTVTQIDGYTAPFETDPLVLNLEDDDNPDVDLLQFSVTIATSLVDDGAVAQLVIDSGLPMETTVESGTASWNVALDNGPHTLMAQAQLGGTSGAFISSSTYNLIIAWTAPTVSIEDPLDGLWTNINVIDVTAVSNIGEGKTVTLNVNGGGEGRAEYTAELDADGIAIFENIELAQGDMPYVLLAEVEDLAGNIAEDAITVNLDTVNPTPVITSPAADDQEFTETNDIEVTVDLTGEADGLEATLQLYNVNDPDNPIAAGNASPLSESGEASYTFVHLADGFYIVEVEFTDLAGNTGSTSRSFRVNQGCWTASISSPANNSYYGIANAYQGNTANGVRINIVVDASQGSLPADPFTPLTLYRNGTPILNGILGEDRKYTFSNVPMPSAGNYQFSVIIEKEGIENNCPASPNPLNLSVDFTAPTIAIVPDPAKTNWPANPTNASTPIPYLAVDTDTAPGTAGFQTSFTFDSNNGVETGQPITLTVTDQLSRYSQVYNSTFGSNGRATFSAVTLYQSGVIPYNTKLKITAQTSDKAGNQSNAYVYYAIADTQAPDFININPPQGVLTLSNDFNQNPDDGFQLRMNLTVTGGSAGTGRLNVTVIPNEGAQYLLGNFDIASNGSALVTGTFQEGGITLRLSHTDDLGNTGTKDIYYSIEYVAELEVYAGSPAVKLTGQTLVWNSTQDALINTAGFQLTFQANTVGFESGLVISLCSDQGLESGDVLPSCTVPGYYKSATGTVQISEGISGFAVITNVPLKNEAIHHVFIEGTDGVGNYDATPVTTLDLDSKAPTVTSVTIDENNASNDNTNIILSSSEGTVSGSNLLVSVTVATSGDTNMISLYKGATLIAGPVTVSGSSHTFTGVSLANGSGTITAIAKDSHNNSSSSSAPAANLNYIVDIYPPTVAFVGGGAKITLNASNCSSNDGNNNCLASGVSVTITQQASDLESLEGGTVRLARTGYFAELTIPSYTGNSVTLDFVNYPIPQGETTLTLTATDPAGNTSTPVNQLFEVDSISPTISFANPVAGTLVEYDADDDDPVYGDGLNDLTLTVAGWTYNISGVSGQTTVRLQKKLHADEDIVENWAYIGQAVATQQVTSSQNNISMSPLDFRRGDFDYRLEATEVYSGNVSYSAYLRVIITFNVSFGIVLEKWSGDGQIGTADDLEDGAKFNYLEDQNSATDVYGMNIRIVTNAPEGLIPDLYVGGKKPEFGGSGVMVPKSKATNGTGEIVGGIVEYQNISVPEAPATTTLWVEVNYPPTDHGEYPVSSILADGNRPVLTFTRPATASVTYNYTNDTLQSTYCQLKLGTSDAIQISADYIRNGQIATISAKDQLGTNVPLLGTTTAVFSSNVATFSDLILPCSYGMSYLELSVSAPDTVGNPSILTATVKAVVDDDPPSNVTPTVCIGGDTDFSSPEAYQQEPAACANAYGCDTPTDDARCSRRGGKATLFWDAAYNDGNQTRGTVASYQVKWFNNTSTPTTPCHGLTWNSVVTPASASVTYGTIAAPGSKQWATVSGLEINSNTSYCFMVKATDATGNVSTTAIPVSREIKYVVEEIDTITAPGASFTAAPWVEWGDFNGDGLDDLAVGDPEADSYTGGVYIYYGRTNGGVPAIPDANIAIADGTGSGWELAVGNFNGDTTAGGKPIYDIAVGAIDGGSYDFEGVVFIYFGAETTGLPSSPDVVISPNAGSGNQLGYALDSFNWNGDEYDDLAIGTYQYAAHESPVYMFLGRDIWAATYTAGDDTAPAYNGDADLVILRADDDNAGDGQFGWNLSHSDLDNDGLDDLLISHMNFNGSPNSDRVYILWSDPTLTDGINSGSNTEPDYVRPPDVNVNIAFSVIISDSEFGEFLRGVPSLDTMASRGDSAESVLISRNFVSPTLPKHDSLLFNGTTDSNNLSASSTYQLFAENSNETFGHSVGWAGDLNEDGYNDIFIAGSSLLRVAFGRNATTLSPTQDIPGVFDSGSTQPLHANGGLDFNGDGKLDIAVVNKSTGQIFIIK